MELSHLSSKLIVWKKTGKNCFGGKGLVVRGFPMAECKGQPFDLFFFS